MTLVAFRMDDVCPEMEWDRFLVFKKLFHQYQIRPLLGIVPDNQDPNLKISGPYKGFWKEMRTLVEESNWSVAQHGFRHQLETRDSGLLGINNTSEFASLDYETQYQKIRDGRQRLCDHGIETDIWMAPAHSYDRNTLRALGDLNFRAVTDGYSLFPYEYMGLKFIPCQFGIPRKPLLGVATICIHSNAVTDNQFQRISRFIHANRSCIVDFQELLAQPARNLARKIIEPAFLLLRNVKNMVAKG